MEEQAAYTAAYNYVLMINNKINVYRLQLHTSLSAMSDQCPKVIISSFNFKSRHSMCLVGSLVTGSHPKKHRHH